MKVGKHNALSGNTASGRTGPAYDGEYYAPTLRLAMWHAFADTRGERLTGHHPVPFSGGGAQICRKVVRACSQPQGLFLHFETRRSRVGECARPGEVPTLGVDSVPMCRT
jgi:hypothetical protein